MLPAVRAMNEPLAQGGPEAGRGDLWSQAPGWRNLTVMASLLTLVAMALPLMAPEPAGPVAAVSPVARIAPAERPVAAAVQAPAQAVVPSAVTAPPKAPAAVAGPVHAVAVPAPAPAPLQTAALPAPQAAPVTAAPETIAPATASPAAPTNVCLIVMQPAPAHSGSGMVMGFEDRATSLARIQKTEANAGGKIDPDYVDNQRVTVRMGNGRYQVFLVPKSMQVHTGDRVTVQDGYRNLNLPCNYVPNLITADLGPAPGNAAAQPPDSPQN
jgi:hypothetical protein